MKATIKVKIYPSSTKEQILKQSLGNSRFIWNKLLELNIERYKKEQKFIFEFDMDKEITKMKKEYKFLNQSPSQSLQQISRKLDRSLNSFLKNKNNVNFPKFKRKSKYGGILIFPQGGFSLKGNKLRLQKIGWIKIKDKITKKPKWNDVILNARQVYVKREVDGFFAYIVYEREKEEKESNGKSVGIDVGIKNTITMSNGEVLSIDKSSIMKLVNKAEYIQSIIDTKKNINKKRGVKYSKRIEELKKKRDKIFKKIGNIKKDFYYKASNYILNSHEYVMIEDLSLSELLMTNGENKKANRVIHKYLQYTSLGRFFNILSWKAELYDRKVIQVNPKDTSKQCSRCGYINHKLELKDRIFKCPSCGLIMDRDLNASINILKRGLKHIASSSGHGEYMHEMVVGGVSL